MRSRSDSGARCAARALVFVVAAVVAALPAESQSLHQITDKLSTGSGPGRWTASGAELYVGSTENLLAQNPSHSWQIMRYAFPGGAKQLITGLDSGIVPVTQSGDEPQVAVTVSDDGQWLAFLSPSDPFGANRDRSVEVFTSSADGSNLTQLTDDSKPNAGTVARLAFAGGGSRIAFVSNSDYLGGNPDEVAQLFVVDRDGGNFSQITNASTRSTFSGLSISDDGTRVVFTYDGDLDGTSNDDFTSELFRVELDGTNDIVQLTDDPEDLYSSFSPALSGDGSKIAFVSDANLTSGNGQHQDELFAIDWDGSGLDKLTESKNQIQGGEGSSQAPTFLDDASQIFFHSNDRAGSGINDDNNFEIYRIKPDGTEQTVLTDTTGVDGSFLPMVPGGGGPFAFFSLYDFDGTNNRLEEIQLFVADDVDGSSCESNCNVVQLTMTDAGAAEQPVISGDGSKIVFVSQGDYVTGMDTDRGGEVFTINFDGTGLFQVTNFSTADEQRQPTITDDASRIAFTSDADPFGLNPDRSIELFVVDADGDASSLEQLTDQPDEKDVADPWFKPDGSVIFYSSPHDPLLTNLELNREIFAIEPDGTLNTITQITSVSFGRSDLPRLTDDASRMVLESTANHAGIGNDEQNSEVFLFELDGLVVTDVLQLTDHDGTETVGFGRGPDITADGALVAFTSNQDLDASMNTDLNAEVFIYDVAAMTIHQITQTSTGASRDVRFSRNGDYLFFTSTSPLVEDDPDLPASLYRADLRSGLGAIVVDRISSFDFGVPKRAIPDFDGDKIVFTGSGNFALNNLDGVDELHTIDMSLPPAQLTVEKTPAGTLARWGIACGPFRYDVARGDVAALGELGGQIEMGPLVCVAADVKGVNTEGLEDAELPAPGAAFYYALRGNPGLSVGPGSYGSGSGGLDRTPGVGDCNP